MKKFILATASLLLAAVALGDASVQQKTQVHFGGALGSVINVFGRGATHEGVVTETAVHGDRKLSRTGDTAEIVDLGEEKVYHVDYGRKTYSVTTFDELRQQFEQAKERSEKRDTARDKQEGPQYEVEFDVKSTGKRAEVNGWNTREEIVTVTVHEKGKKIEQSGGFILTSDMWMGPRVAAMQELTDFDLRFMRKVYGEAFATDMRQMTAMMAMTPAFGKAMKVFAEKRSHFEGTPIRTKMTFQSVAGTEQNADQQETAPASALGGLMSRMRRRHDSNESEQGGRGNTMFESNSDVLKASTGGAAAAVAIPDGFRQR